MINEKSLVDQVINSKRKINLKINYDMKCFELS